MDESIFGNPESSSAIRRSWWLEYKNGGWLLICYKFVVIHVYLLLDWAFYIWFVIFIIRYWSAWISLFKISQALLRVNSWVSHSYLSMRIMWHVTCTVCIYVLLVDDVHAVLFISCSELFLLWQLLWGHCGKRLWPLLKYMQDRQLKVQKIHMMEDMIQMVVIRA